MTLNLNFGNRKKLNLTQKPTRKFEFKFGMQGHSVAVPQLVIWFYLVHTPRTVFGEVMFSNLVQGSWRNKLD